VLGASPASVRPEVRGPPSTASPTAHPRPLRNQVRAKNFTTSSTAAITGVIGDDASTERHSEDDADVPQAERPADAIAVLVDLRLGRCRVVPMAIGYRYAAYDAMKRAT